MGIPRSAERGGGSAPRPRELLKKLDQNFYFGLRLSIKVSLRDDYNGALPHTPPKGCYPFGIPL